MMTYNMIGTVADAHQGKYVESEIWQGEIGPLAAASLLRALKRAVVSVHIENANRTMSQNRKVSDTHRLTSKHADGRYKKERTPADLVDKESAGHCECEVPHLNTLAMVVTNASLKNTLVSLR